MSEAHAKTPAAPGGPTALKRGISPKLLLLFIVGDMVGGGIYALIGQVAAITGGAIWSAFLLALTLALFTAFAYAELVTKYPRAGGAAYYVHRAFQAPFLSFLVAFAVVMSGITSASALAMAFAGDYLAAFFEPPVVVVAMLFIVIMAWINHRGITESVTVNAVFTVIELAGLLLIVAIGVATLCGGNRRTGSGTPHDDALPALHSPRNSLPSRGRAGAPRRPPRSHLTTRACAPTSRSPVSRRPPHIAGPTPAALQSAFVSHGRGLKLQRAVRGGFVQRVSITVPQLPSRAQPCTGTRDRNLSLCDSCNQ